MHHLCMDVPTIYLDIELIPSETDEVDAPFCIESSNSDSVFEQVKFISLNSVNCTVLRPIVPSYTIY